MTLREKIQLLFEISCSAAISSIVGYFATDPAYSKVFFEATKLFGSLTILFVFAWFFHPNVDFLFWNIMMKIRLISPIIGILQQKGVRYHFSRITYDEWETAFQNMGYKVEPVNIGQISNRYSAIINPYGETYPEEELIELITFNKIKKYIINGGLFLNVAGIPFFYGFDYLHDLNPTLSKEQKTFLFRPHQTPTGVESILVEQSVFPTTGFSLVETIMYEHFKILTTWEKEQVRICTQNDVCRRFIGDIVNIGGTNQIFEFRAVRKQSRKWIPFLMTNSDIGEIYPIAGVPYGRGCLVVCGFHLDISQTSSLWNQHIHNGCFQKIVTALHNLIQNRKNGNISLCTNRW